MAQGGNHPSSFPPLPVGRALGSLPCTPLGGQRAWGWAGTTVVGVSSVVQLGAHLAGAGRCQEMKMECGQDRRGVWALSESPPPRRVRLPLPLPSSLLCSKDASLPENPPCAPHPGPLASPGALSNVRHSKVCVIVPPGSARQPGTSRPGAWSGSLMHPQDQKGTCCAPRASSKPCGMHSGSRAGRPQALLQKPFGEDGFI